MELALNIQQRKQYIKLQPGGVRIVFPVLCPLVCPLSVFPDTSSHLLCTGSSRGSGSSVLASVHAKAEGVQFTGFPNPI